MFLGKTLKKILLAQKIVSLMSSFHSEVPRTGMDPLQQDISLPSKKNPVVLFIAGDSRSEHGGNSNPFNREGHIINILQQTTNDFCHVSRNLPNPQWDRKH